MNLLFMCQSKNSLHMLKKPGQRYLTLQIRTRNRADAPKHSNLFKLIAPITKTNPGSAVLEVAGILKSVCDLRPIFQYEWTIWFGWENTNFFIKKLLYSFKSSDTPLIPLIDIKVDISLQPTQIKCFSLVNKNPTIDQIRSN